LHVLNFITRGDKGASGAKVSRLAARPLAVAELQVARADIVDERVTKDVIERAARSRVWQSGQSLLPVSFVIDFLTD